MSRSPKSSSDRGRAASARRRDERRRETRDALLNAAVRLFREQGFEGFSLRQVAHATGYSPTTVYLYFEDKDDLLFHVALEGFRRFGEALDRAYASAEAPVERLAALGRAYVEFGLDHPVHYRLMFMLRGEFLDRTSPGGEEPIIDSFGVLRRVVDECLAEGSLEPGDGREHAMLIWTGVHGIVALAVSTPYLDRDAALALQARQFAALRRGVLR